MWANQLLCVLASRDLLKLTRLAVVKCERSQEGYSRRRGDLLVTPLARLTLSSAQQRALWPAAAWRPDLDVPSLRLASPPRGDAGWRTLWRWEYTHRAGTRGLRVGSPGRREAQGGTDCLPACFRRTRRRRATCSGCSCSSRMRAANCWAPRSTYP